MDKIIEALDGRRPSRITALALELGVPATEVAELLEAARSAGLAIDVGPTVVIDGVTRNDGWVKTAKAD